MLCGSMCKKVEHQAGWCICPCMIISFWGQLSLNVIWNTLLLHYAHTVCHPLPFVDFKLLDMHICTMYNVHRTHILPDILVFAAVEKFSWIFRPNSFFPASTSTSASASASTKNKKGNGSVCAGELKNLLISFWHCVVQWCLVLKVFLCVSKH